MLEIKNAMVVAVYIFLKHYGLYGRFADSTYFYTDNTIHESLWMHNPVCVYVTSMVVTIHIICEDLLNLIKHLFMHTYYACKNKT